MLHGSDLTNQCPCGSNKPFMLCCQPALEGYKPAVTAEALMRSRYTAFAIGSVDYLIQTTATEHRNPADKAIIGEQIKATTWLGLEIVDKKRGSRSDETGIVEFIAHFASEGETAALHERSRFRKENGLWVYIDGDVEVRG